MRNIKRQFGPAFATALAKSPTLVKDLQEIRKRGLKIRRIKTRNTFFSVHEKKTIYVGTGTVSVRLSNLGHESMHLLAGVPVLETFARCRTRRQFINARLDDEARAEAHGMKIVGELLAAGVHVSEQELFWYAKYKKGGRQAIRAALPKTTTCHSDQLYPEYYGKIYDRLKDMMQVLIDRAKQEAESEAESGASRRLKSKAESGRA